MSIAYSEAMAFFESNPKKCADMLLSISEEDPIRPIALGNAAQALIIVGDYEEAESILGYLLADGDVKVDNLIAANFWRVWGNLKVKIGDFSGAYLCMKESLENLNVSSEGELGHEIEQQIRQKIIIEKASTLISMGALSLSQDRYDEAIESFEEARDVAMSLERDDSNIVQHALSNIALAAQGKGDFIRAEYALLESYEMFISDINSDENLYENNQFHRTCLAIAQLNVVPFQGEEANIVFEKAIEYSMRVGNLSEAYLRLSMFAQFHFKNENYDVALDTLNRAISIENSLSGLEPHVPRIRLLEWQIKRALNASDVELLEPLLVGANLWFKWASLGRYSPLDIHVSSSGMHEHFRTLSRSLFGLERFEEALIAFEVGRAIAHGISLDSRYISALDSIDIFSNTSISVDILTDIRDRLGEGEVSISLAVFPEFNGIEPSLVAFVLSQTSVEVAMISLSSWRSFEQNLKRLPKGLDAGLGVKAIPEDILKLAKEMVEKVKGFKVRAIFPYADLHVVPWRVLLRHLGLEWDSISFLTGFGLLMPRNEKVYSGCVALGYGHAGSGELRLNLGDEAHAFSKFFGDDSEVMVPCLGQDLKLALSRSKRVVLVSCHGAQSAEELRLVLSLKDKSWLFDEIMPNLIKAQTVILSACESGVYGMVWGDFPIGAAPDILRRGARCCICARWRIRAYFASALFTCIAKFIVSGYSDEIALGLAFAELEKDERWDIWQDFACVELLSSF